MNRPQLLGLALTATLLLTAIAATAAHAELPEVLKPAAGVSTYFSGGSNTTGKITPKLNPKKAIECTLVGFAGLIEHSGATTITIDFTGCIITNTTSKCRSLGDALGTILVGGTDLLVTLENTARELVLGDVVTFKELHLECQGNVLILVKGSVIGVFDKTNGEPLKSGEEVLEALLLFQEKEPGVQLYKTCLSNKVSCEGKKWELLIDITGTFEEASWREEGSTFKFHEKLKVEF